MARPTAGRAAVLRYRVRTQQLDREPDAGLGATDADVLDLGVQDSGTGGALWALANRGVPVPADGWPQDDLALVWTVRGAPHAYRRRDLVQVEAATRPRSPADAARRLLAAGAALTAAGIPADEGLATVAAHLRAIVTEPMAKGDVSGRVSARLGEPYVHHCRACGVTHVHEMPFRLGALRAGLELEPGTSPPVLRPIAGWPGDGPADDASPGDASDRSRLDPVRGYLHHLGPAAPADVAGYLDSPVREVTSRWPADAVEVEVDGRRRWLLDADVATLGAAADADGPPTVRLLGPFDLFLQARDRQTLVPAPAHRSALWPVLGRPGAVTVDGEVVGTWRPRTSGRSLRLRLDRWVPWDRGVEEAVRVQAERLAAHRGATLAAVE